MDQMRRNPHAHEAQLSSRLIRLIRIFRCLCGCQDLMFRLTCTGARSAAHIKSPFSLSNGSRMTTEKRIPTFKTHLILYSVVYGIMIQVKENKREVKSHHEFNICCVFVTLFFPLFFLLSLKSSFMVSSRLEN